MPHQLCINECLAMFVLLCVHVGWQPQLLSCHGLMCNDHGLMCSDACWHGLMYSSHAFYFIVTYLRLPNVKHLMHYLHDCRLKMLQEAGLKPDRVTYNTLLKSCMRNRLADQALQTHREMMQLGIPVSLPPNLLRSFIHSSNLFTVRLFLHSFICSLVGKVSSSRVRCIQS